LAVGTRPQRNSIEQWKSRRKAAKR